MPELTQEFATLPVDALEPHPDNPRRGDVDAIAESIRHNGFFGAVLVQAPRGSGFFVQAYTDEGDTVYDPFLGSGSTVIAAAQLGRVGYGMECSPGYVDASLTRIQRILGEDPVNERTGEPHHFSTPDATGGTVHNWGGAIGTSPPSPK